MTVYVPKTYVTGDILSAADMTAINAAVGSLAGETSSLLAAVNTKAPTDNPTFTGTVGGITKGMVGLGNVDNTADNAKVFTTSQITSGTLPVAQIGTGIPSAGAYVDGGTGAWTTLPAPSDPDAVKLTGNQSVDGVKTFTSAPAVPDNSWSIADTLGLQATVDAAARADGTLLDLRAQPTQLPRLIDFYGDSITLYGEGYPSYAQVLSGGRITANRIISNPGQTSSSLLANINDQVIAGTDRGGACLILCGTNDAGLSVPLATYAANIKAMVDALKVAGIVPILGTPPPRNDTSDSFSRTYAAWIAQWAAANGVFLADTAKYVSAPTGWKAGFNVDDVHPSPQGNYALGLAVVESLSKNIASAAEAVQVRAGEPNLQTNSTFLVDSNGDGLPDGMEWQDPGGSSSLVPDPDGFQWMRLTAAGGNRPMTFANGVGAGAATWQPGDYMRFSARVRSAQSVGTSGAGLEATVQCFKAGGGFDRFQVSSWTGGLSRKIDDGVVAREFTVPADTTSITWGFLAGPGDGTYDLALPTLVNLSKLNA